MVKNHLFLQLFGLIVFLLLSKCDDTKGHAGVSDSANESKKRDVFVSEYNVIPNPYEINDTLSIKVLSVWVENQWGFGQFDDETIKIKDKYQLVIKVAANTLHYYSLTWRIGVDENRYIRSCGVNCLVTDFNQLPNEIEEWKVQNGRGLDSLSKKSIIGIFKVEKKHASKFQN